MEFEYKRLFEPKCNKDKLLPHLIPYYGGIKLCNSIGSTLLGITSKVMCISTAFCIINTTIMRILEITSGWYPIISIYYNLTVFLINYILLVIISHKSAITIQASASAFLCFIPPLSFYMQSTVVRHFFKVNKDELRGTFNFK